MKCTQSEESALRIRDPSYPVNKNSWKIDTNIPVRYISILNFDSAPGGLGSGPSILATSSKKKKEGRREKILTLLKYVREVTYYTKQANNVPQSRESQVTRAKASALKSHKP